MAKVTNHIQFFKHLLNWRMKAIQTSSTLHWPIAAHQTDTHKDMHLKMVQIGILMTFVHTERPYIKSRPNLTKLEIPEHPATLSLQTNALCFVFSVQFSLCVEHKPSSFLCNTFWHIMTQVMLAAGKLKSMELQLVWFAWLEYILV